MGYGRLIAHQVASIADQAKAGLITERQAREQVARQTTGVSAADKAEAMNVLTDRLQNRS